MIRREPGAASWDRRARYVLLRAIQAHQDRAGPVPVWITSPGPEFRNLDRGGRTRTERAFTRAIYYPVFTVPRSQGELPMWSLKLSWGPIERHGSRYGRHVAVRVFRYRAGYQHAARGSRKWIEGDGRSSPGARVDA